jgi:hypothetical protein
MKRSLTILVAGVVLAASTIGCDSQDIPPAFRGQMYDGAGKAALWLSGGDGLEGDILGPGTYYTGMYDSVRMVDCSDGVEHENLTSLTRDGIQFGLEAEITYAIDCSDDDVVKRVLTTLRPDQNGVIRSKTAYARYVRPSISEVVREAIAPHMANEVNTKRQDIIDAIQTRFAKSMQEGNRRFIKVSTLALTNMDFPEKLDQANVARAEQDILREKAVAERERVEAETETAMMRKALRAEQGGAEAAKIDAIGEALRRNPEYLQFHLQEMMPGIYEQAGEHGNLIITAPNPSVLVTPRPTKTGQ